MRLRGGIDLGLPRKNLLHDGHGLKHLVLSLESLSRTAVLSRVRTKFRVFL